MVSGDPLVTEVPDGHVCVALICVCGKCSSFCLHFYPGLLACAHGTITAESHGCSTAPSTSQSYGGTSYNRVSIFIITYLLLTYLLTYAMEQSHS